MKPLSEKTYVDQALKNGKGVTWLDDARIPITEAVNFDKMENRSIKDGAIYGGGDGFMPEGNPIYSKSGRFPANLICSDDILNDGKVRKSGKDRNPSLEGNDTAFFGNGSKYYNPASNHGDSGSFSRFFSLDAWCSERLKELPESVQRTFPFLVCAKASKREKNAGLEALEDKHHGLREGGRFHSGGRTQDEDGNWIETGSAPKSTKNTHATVKPLQLMSYLITLGSREGDIILDPFLGSGTTACAAKMLGRKYIGIEREEEYVKIAEARIASVPSLTED